ncbi:hypothetical protein [Niallia sp. 03133]|uniref:hypothetical protein n=1 Tax=Niallia sp. 03133 TaxID=3458060 RepID=UPI0040440500
MMRIISVLLIGIGGYFLLTKRYRVMNVVLRNRFVRQYLIKLVMSFPGIRNKMMGTVFSGSARY